MSSFVSGNNSSNTGFGGFGLEWWYTERTFEQIDRVSTAIRSNVEKYSNIDFESLKDLIILAIQESTSDKAIFDVDGFLFRNGSLFDIKSCKPNEFSERLWRKIESKLDSSIIDWCTIYPLSRIKTPSFCLSDIDVYVVNKSDIEYWHQISERFPYLKYFDMQTGRVQGFNSFGLDPYHYESLLVSVDNGTRAGAKFSASIKFRLLMSVLIAQIVKSTSKIASESSQPANDQCLQVPCSNSTISESTISTIEGLIPYYIKDYQLNDDDVVEIEQWFSSLYMKDIHDRERVLKTGHFVNLAMNSKGIESYVNYFVSLDALFGIRGNVENSIVEGVINLTSDEVWGQKTKRLFDLRNELVHGGSRFLAEWNGYTNYIDHFKSKPENDIKQLSLTCLNCAASMEI